MKPERLDPEQTLARRAEAGEVVRAPRIRGGAASSVCAGLRTLPGYDAAKKQILSHDAAGECEWLDVAECEEEA